MVIQNCIHFDLLVQVNKQTQIITPNQKWAFTPKIKFNSIKAILAINKELPTIKRISTKDLAKDSILLNGKGIQFYVYCQRWHSDNAC